MNKELEIMNINWEILGAQLALLSSAEQSAFFRGFCDEMLRYEISHCRDMQLTYIREGHGDQKGLTKKQQEILAYLGPADE